MANTTGGNMDQLMQLIMSNMPSLIANGRPSTIIDIIPPESDNEMVFEILIDIYRNSLSIMDNLLQARNLAAMQHQLSLPEDNDLEDMHKLAFMIIGYTPIIETITAAEAKELIPHSFIRNGQLELSRFHPYRLMEQMRHPPACYSDFFLKPEYLPNVICLKPLPDGRVQSIKFNKLNFINGTAPSTTVE